MPTRHAAISNRLITRYGGLAMLSRMSGADETVYPPIPGGVTDFVVSVAITGEDAEARGGSLVERADVVLSMRPHEAVEPQIGDTITIGSETFAVMRVEAVRGDPAGAVLHWRVEGRR
jgi:hypothetical protein